MNPEPDVRASSLENSVLLARLPDVSLLTLTVVGTRQLTPALRRLSLGGTGLADFNYQPGQDLMFSVPSPDGGPHFFRRRYTIRQFDPATSVLDIDVVVHGDGPGAAWASSASVGDPVEAIGPRGKITIDADADWHLFVADESGLPNVFAMVESMADGARAFVVIEVDGAEDELPMAVPEGVDLALVWVHREGAEAGTARGLVEAVGSLALPEQLERGHAYVAGELGVVAQVRALLAERGIPREKISPKAYWRLGVANAAHGEPERD